MISLLQLDYFRRLAATEHITQTAKELYISQTALSSMIIGLEKELGVQLFDRSRRSVHLNEAGRTYLKYVEDVFAALENGRAALQDMADSREKQVSLAMGSSLVWMPMFHSFRKTFPNLVIRQSNYNTSGLNNVLRNMSVDFVVAGDKEIDVEGVERELVMCEDLYLCVSPNHPLAERSEISLEEIQDEAFVSITTGYPWRSFCDRLFAEAGVKVHTVIECDYTMRGPLISSGFGVALTSSTARHVDLLKPNKYIRISDGIAKSCVYLYWNPKRYISEAAREFRSFCLDFYRDPANLDSALNR